VQDFSAAGTFSTLKDGFLDATLIHRMKSIG
jgi:hypothetical protein